MTPPELRIKPPCADLYADIQHHPGASGQAVFKARHLASNQHVALVVLCAESPSAMLENRRRKHFLRAARALQAVQHGNVIRCFGSFEAVCGGFDTAGMAVEWCPQSLEELVLRHPDGLPAEQAATLLGQALEGLDVLHRMRIAVRDLRPDNLRLGEDGNLRIADLSRGRTPDAAPTLVEGSRYAAADVLDGSLRKSDDKEPPPEAYFAADVGALGLVFYEALVGRERWRSLPVLASVYGEPGADSPLDRDVLWRNWQADESKQLPPLRSLRPDVGGALASVVDRMTAKARAQRFSTPAEAHAALASAPPHVVAPGRSKAVELSGALARAVASDQDGGAPSGEPTAAAGGGGASAAPADMPAAQQFGAFLPPGHVLAGRYHVEREIGRGGMGVVYCCRDTAGDRTVALKVLYPHWSDPVSIKRFQREAEMASKLESPHIVRCLDSGVDQGLHYMAMEFVDGPNVQQLIQQKGALDENQAVAIAIQILNALELAHKAGIVHRDVKSPNILIGKDGVAKLADFGIEFVLTGTRLTTTGATLGTPEYMSPEQCGGVKELTPASDLYSLGIVLFEMLSGRAPFSAKTPFAVYEMHLHDAPPDPRKLNPKLPNSLVNIVLTALVKEPKHRFASARQMIEALEGKRKVPRPGRSRLSQRDLKLTSAHKAAIAAGLVIVTLVVTAAVVSAQRRAEQTRLAEQARVEAEADREMARREAEEQERQRLLAEQRAAEEARQAELRREEALRAQQLAAETERRREAEARMQAAEAAERLAQQQEEQERRHQAELQAAREREQRLAAERRAEEQRQLAADRQRDAERATQRAAEAERQRQAAAEEARQAALEQQRLREAAEREAEARAAAERWAAEQEARRRASMPSAQIHRIWVNHNMQGRPWPGMRPGENTGMQINIHFSVANLVGQRITVAALFGFQGGQSLRDMDGNFTTTDGDVCVTADVSPQYQDTEWQQLALFMPYSQLHMAPGQYNLEFEVQVAGRNGATIYANSGPQYFTYTGR